MQKVKVSFILIKHSFLTHVEIKTYIVRKLIYVSMFLCHAFCWPFVLGIYFKHVSSIKVQQSIYFYEPT